MVLLNEVYESVLNKGQSCGQSALSCKVRNSPTWTEIVIIFRVPSGWRWFQISASQLLSYNEMGWNEAQILSHLSDLLCQGQCFYEPSQLMFSHWPNLVSQFPLGVHYGANEWAKRVLISASEASFCLLILCAVHQVMVSISCVFYYLPPASHSCVFFRSSLVLGCRSW